MQMDSEIEQSYSIDFLWKKGVEHFLEVEILTSIILLKGNKVEVFKTLKMSLKRYIVV
jgi:hypothetical protein